MITGTQNEQMEKLLPIVADSWRQLRGCDVFRLLYSAVDAGIHPYFAMQYMATKRRDLIKEINEASQDIANGETP